MTVSTGVWDRVVTLPCSTWMPETELESVIGAVYRTHAAMMSRGSPA